MAKPEKISDEIKDEEKDSLKGSLTAVLLLGSFILISWFGVWMLFLSR